MSLLTRLLSIAKNTVAVIPKSLYTWGGAASGQLGQNNTVNKSSPTQVGTKDWISISAGNSFTVAVNSDGTLWAWGQNDAYQLGLYDAIYRSSPVQVTSMSNWSSVSAGASHSTVLSNDGLLYTFGSNTYGQLGKPPTLVWNEVHVGTKYLLALRDDGTIWGTGSSYASNTGVRTQLDLIYNESSVKLSWKKISGGENFGVGLSQDGTLYSWGTLPGRAAYEILPVDTSVKFTDVSAGLSHMILLGTDGFLYAYGYNNYGQLGIGNRTNTNSITKIGDSTWQSISAGDNFSTAIDSSGKLFSWGYNINGQLGLNDRIARSSPTQISTESFNSVSAGNGAVGAISVAGSLFVWGLNSSGELGLNDLTSRSSPVQLGTSSWVFVNSGGTNMGGVLIDNTVWGWGDNVHFQLASDSNQYGKSSPVQLTASGTKLAFDNGVTAIIALDGTLLTRGFAQYGATGGYLPPGVDKSNLTAISTAVLPTTRVGVQQVGTSSWTQVAAGGFHTIATNSSNKLFGWGRNDYFQTGVGDKINRSSPTQVSSLSSVSIVQISAGEYHSHAIASDGKLYGWGKNDNSEVGYVPRKWNQVTTYSNFGIAALDNTGVLWAWGTGDAAQGTNSTTVARSSPTQVYSDVRFKNIYGTAGNILAIDLSDKLWGWGTNTNSNLGIYSGTMASISYPIQIMTSISWSMVGCGLRYGAGIDSNGILRAWGIGVTNGQLTTADRSSPAQIASGSYSQVSVGYTHAAAIKTDGTLWVWGYGTNGILGINATANRSSPVQVGADTDWTGVLAGSTATYGFKSNGTIWAWGLNTSGQLGIATTTSVSNPTQVALDATSKSYYLTRFGTSTPTFVMAQNKMGQNATQAVQFVDSNNIVWVSGNFSAGTLGVFPWQTLQTTSLKMLYAYGDPSTVLGPRVNQSAVVHGNSTMTSTMNVHIDTDGVMQVFGYNSTGQLGIPTWPLGTTGNAQLRSSPVQTGSGNQPVVAVPTVLNEFVSHSYNQVSSGRSTTSAIKTDGTVWSWGDNTAGKLGMYSNRVEYVASGYYGFVAVMADNRVYYSGSTTSAIGIDSNRSSPTQVLASGGFNSILASDYWLSLPKNVPGEPKKRIQLGNIGMHLDHLGRAWAWGGGTSLNLAARGVGSTVANFIGSPKLTLNDYWPITKLTQGGATTFFLSGTTFYGMGSRAQGQLGDNSVAGNAPLPVLISTDVVDFWQPGNNNIIYKKTDNSFWYIGVDATGWTAFTSTGYPYAFNPIYYRSSPTQIMSGAQGVEYSQIVSDALGSYVGMALKPDKTLWSWGTDFYGCIGFSNVSVIRTSPTFLMSDVEECIPATNGFFVRKTDNTIWAWGDNQYGQFGNGTVASRSSPVQIFAGGRSSFVQVATTARASYLVDFDGNLWVAGYNNVGQLGVNDTVSRTTFTAINFPATTSPTYLFNTVSTSFNQVSTNGNSAVAIKNDNTLWAWGDNTNGQLGTSDIISRSSPTQVTSINNTLGTFTQVSSGYNHTALIFNKNS